MLQLEEWHVLREVDPKQGYVWATMSLVARIWSCKDRTLKLKTSAGSVNVWLFVLAHS